ncbi:MAG: hybrid sensor histidine kinase/response regulator [Pseudanabaena frigida]|uniref:histidine kinase n=1 Tax=Pseudanabaena frigida TaxID=945775 RepID=A0A2W4XZ73_9CYAN|nr:MAG: hybrid sensor histidine kinase/response regulator [Pseudanabaena frigida]
MSINTLDDREWQVRLLFLDEVKEFLASIELEVLGLSDRGLQRSAINQILRSAHSMKGGAAMMGFHVLSEFAHRLEDFFKILQVKKQTTISTDMESQFLAAIDGMAKIASIHKQRKIPDESWLHEYIAPPFERLHDILGDLSLHDEATLLSEEEGQDMRVLMFSTEVDACLERITNVLDDPNSLVLREEFELTSQEFGCLGEMLELPAFSQLCEEIGQALQDERLNLRDVTTSALEVWRRSQALVLVGQFQALPNRFELVPLNSPPLEDRDLRLPIASLQEENHSLISDRSLLGIVSQDRSKADLFNAKADSNAKNPDVTIRIPLRYLEALNDRFGELNVERSGLKLQMRRMRDLVQLLNSRMHRLEQSNAHLRETYDRVITSEPLISANLTASETPKDANYPNETSTSEGLIPYSSRFDLLEMDRFSNSHVLSREIMDSAVQLQEVASDLETALDDLESTERGLGRASRQMQTAIEQARMRMLSEILGGFPRLLRDLSVTHGKQVEFLTRGTSTLVERSVLEVLEDPLLHLIRNAFDHGIETPEARIAAGKSAKGKIEVTAGYRGNQTIITVSDDGNGIDSAKLRDRALQMGLSKSDLDASNENALLDLIFEPGFSTADRITELSGRGVGMDVVRSNLSAIGGTIRVETETGKGSTFILTVPVSLSIARILLFETNGLQMAILTSAVEEILLVRDITVHKVVNQEVLDWEGYSVPLLKLGERLHFSRPHIQFETENRPIVDEPLALIVAHNNVPFGLQVDRYWGEQEVTIRGVKSEIPMPSGFRGCAILGGGKLVPLVDIDSLIDWMITDADLLPSKISTPAPDRRERRTTVLVVDDSINVRRFLAMTLEKSGYRVEQAKDGYEAIEKLRKLQTLSNNSQIKAAICDIEMPRLDGFGFLVQSRSDDSCRHIPVIMLTSRSGAKHRDLAMRLGASAYFTKPFKDSELLQTLSQLVSNVK